MNNPLKMPETNDRAYLVGGSVRDMLMKRQPQDYDIAVLKAPRRYASKLAAMHRTRVIELGRDEKRTWRIVGRDVCFDVTRIKGASIEDDLRLRDFTINALARDLRSGNIIDVTGGRKDLADKSIRMVSSTAFDHDPVRLLRAYRIAAKTGFNIEPRTAATIMEKGHKIRMAQGERIRDEWFALLQHHDTTPVIRAMGDSGLIIELFPELADLRKCVQNRHHEYDGFEHTMETFGHLENEFHLLGQFFPRSADRLKKTMGPQRRAIVKNAALMHDIGKPGAVSTDIQGRRHFYGHEKIGARMIDRIGRRYKFSNHERVTTAFIVRHHLRPLFLFNQAKTTGSIGKARARFFLACDELVPDIVLHAVADSRAKTGDMTKNQEAFTAYGDQLLESYFADYRLQKKGAPLLNGHDLMRIFRLAPSPLIGAVLRQVEEARIAGRISTPEEAKSMARTILSQQASTVDESSGPKGSRSQGVE